MKYIPKVLEDNTIVLDKTLGWEECLDYASQIKEMYCILRQQAFLLLRSSWLFKKRDICTNFMKFLSMLLTEWNLIRKSTANLYMCHRYNKEL